MKHSGTGLGLSICSQLVSLMRGSIGLKSSLGEGSTFSVKLPLRQVALTPTPKSSRETVRALSDSASRTEFLGDVAADSSKMAAESPSYDLIFMDIQMPVLNGIASTPKIRSHGFAGPIIALTTFAEKSNTNKCNEVGMNHFLAKPVKKAQLQELLMKLSCANRV